MKFQEILREFEIKEHYLERYIQRFQDSFDVITIHKITKETTIVGKYIVTPDVKQKVQTIIRLIEKPYYVGEIGTVMVIGIHRFHVSYRDTIFSGPPDVQIRNKQNMMDNTNYFHYLQERPFTGEKLNSEQNLSQGIYLVCFIVNNSLTTFMLTKSSDPSVLISRAKRLFTRTKNFVFIANPLTELDAYIDVEMAKQNPEEQPPTEEPPEEPQISDDDKRKLAYKERMKKELERQKKLWKHNKR